MKLSKCNGTKLFIFTVEYWNHYRPHEGLAGDMVMPYLQDMDAPVREVSFLGGLLYGYRRKRLTA